MVLGGCKVSLILQTILCLKHPSNGVRGGMLQIWQLIWSMTMAKPAVRKESGKTSTRAAWHFPQNTACFMVSEVETYERHTPAFLLVLGRGFCVPHPVASFF